MSPNDTHFLAHAMARVLLAALLGGVIGLERELKHKPAGVRTIMLITIGSALFTILSEGLAGVRGGDPQRIAAQLIPGIGFLGAGAIIRSGGSVIGLTTAAAIFVMASVGMAAGGGLMILAAAVTALLLLLLVPIGWAEKRFEARMEAVGLSFVTGQPEACMLSLRAFARQAGFDLRDLKVHQGDGTCAVEFTADVPVEREEEIIKRLHEIQNAHK